MLPCQADVDFLLSSSHGWWLIQQHMMVHLPNSIENDFQGLFNVNAVAKGDPITIAKLLLCVAICIQQLEPEIDMSKLQMKSPPREIMSRIVDFLIRNVTSDDDITGSIEGALAISELLGLHRVAVRTSKESPDLKETKRHYLLYQVSRGERYLSTLLGVPSGTGSGVLPFDNIAAWLSPEDLYHKHLYDIAGLILARNQEDYTHSFSTTQIIGEKLEALAEQMPSTWWEIPTNIPQSRTLEASVQFERVMCQIWHFELATLLHLPFMLRAANTRRYEYSRISCLDACRSLIKRWVSIRETNGTFYFSNLLDFEAFTAATTLLLGLFVSHGNKIQDALQERDEDFELMEMVVRNFERLKRHGSRVSVGDQSILVIRTLQGFLRGERSSGSLRLEIPFFGIIKVALNGAVEPLAGERILGANTGHNNFYTRSKQRTIFSSMAKENCTPDLEPWSRVKGFEQGVAAGGNSANRVVRGPDTILQPSGGHLVLPESSDNQETLDASEWSFSPDDMIFFDSLVNTDLAGNWTL
ncbi:hypothetical protein N7481_012610 [Penicillium waksmanii]|uniref:uncharacterized protein n=1 Tax=Penicillium waksmanii TaxID=69791 RepID=UPI0025469851|nr:uncharacterized protein N7481_012610 [Penicillium waksmanii]KAJ5965896.1 hypothetical protein N7481_012610 [Penicillium waksmanii]